jgi:hypothetical protein
MSTPTDTPEITQHSMSCEYPEGCSCGASKFNSLVLKLRALEARVKELEEQCAIIQSQVDNADVNLKQVKLCAEAGQVPEGALRIWAYWLEGFECWHFKDIPVNNPTHVIDIYPPQQ